MGMWAAQPRGLLPAEWWRLFLCSGKTGTIPCSRLMMMIQMGILNRAGSQFNEDKPRWKQTMLPTLHWFCVHITLELLQRQRKGLTFSFYCNGNESWEIQQNRLLKALVYRCDHTLFVFEVQIIISHHCENIFIEWFSSTYVIKDRGRQMMLIKRDKVRQSSAKVLTGKMKEVVKEGQRATQSEPTVAAVYKPLKVNFYSSPSCQYPGDQNLCRPAICFRSTLCPHYWFLVGFMWEWTCVKALSETNIWMWMCGAKLPTKNNQSLVSDMFLDLILMLCT